MRILFFISLLFLSLLKPAAAQIIPAVTLGPKAGLNSSVLYTDVDGYREDESIGYHVGIFIRLLNKSRIFIQPEAYFDLKGGAFEYDIDKNDPLTPSLEAKQNAILDVDLHTVNFPLLAGFKILDLSGFNIRLMAGPMATLIIKEKTTLTADGQDKTNLLPDMELITDPIWSFQAGAGIDIFMFAIDFRYEFGLNDISNIPTIEAKTYLYNLSLGLKLF